MRRLALLVLLAAAGARPLDGQVPASMPPVDSGLVIRAWLDSGQMRGRLLMPMRATDDSVRYCRYPGRPCDGGVTDEFAWLQLGTVRHLDVQLGTRWKKGGVWGGVIGLILGWSAVYLNSWCDTADCEYTGNKKAMVLASSAILTAGFGAVVGTGFPRFERRY